MSKNKSVCDVGDDTMKRVAEYCKAHPLKHLPEDDMDGCCPFVYGTDRENGCGLGGICYGGASTCEYRRRTTCKNNYGEYCDKYDTCDCKDCEMTPPVDKDGCTGGYCSCKECQTKTECVALNCGELCPCRRDENKNFGDKEVSNAKAD